MGFKLVDMAETPEEQEQSYPVILSGITGPGKDKPAITYPYGLHLDLNQESMKKLGLNEMPEIGEVMHIMVMAKVDRLSASESDYGGGHKCVGLQIIQMGMESENKEYSYKEKLYDKDADEEEGE